jgi:hypothetical protein
MARGSVRNAIGAEAAGVGAASRFAARVKNRAAKPAAAVKPSSFSKKVLRDGSWLTACDLMCLKTVAETRDALFECKPKFAHFLPFQKNKLQRCTHVVFLIGRPAGYEVALR